MSKKKHIDVSNVNEFRVASSILEEWVDVHSAIFWQKDDVPVALV